MMVEFWLRTPGDHNKIDEMELDCVPREGEAVCLRTVTRQVHSVTYIVDPPRSVARVLLHD
jgi:hypothetical protein